VRIIYFGNNWLGWKCLEWLADQDEEIAGVVLHPSEKRSYGKKILDAVDLPDSHIFRANRLQEPAVADRIQRLEPDIGVSVLFGYILKAELLNIFERGCVNLHPAYLPYNRGAYPNVWSLIDETPAGVTLHRIDEKIDTGDILARRRVEKRITDTGRSLYRRLEQASLDLFKDAWPALRAGNLTAITQNESEGTYHRSDDVNEVDEIDLDATYTARELINILRARTFPPHSGAYFKEKGRKVYVSVELSESDL